MKNRAIDVNNLNSYWKKQAKLNIQDLVHDRGREWVKQWLKIIRPETYKDLAQNAQLELKYPSECSCTPDSTMACFACTIQLRVMAAKESHQPIEHTCQSNADA